MFHNFIWNKQKNKENIKKHGVSLKAGMSVFEDYFRIERHDEENSCHDEDRYITIGKDHRTKVLFVTYTMRDEESKIRLLSVRKAKNSEIRQYENYMQKGENMNKDTTYTRDTREPFDGSDIDYSAIDKMTDKKVHQAALEDPRAQPQTTEELQKFKRVNPFAKKS